MATTSTPIPQEKPQKVRLSACNGTVLKEQSNLVLAENNTVQIVVP